MLSKNLSRREFLQTSGAVVGGAAMLAACGGSGSTNPGSAGPVTIKFWNATYATSSSSDKSKKKDQYYIYQAIKRFNAQNPGITVQIQDVPTTAEMFTRYRVASIARNGPDVMGMWSGNYMLQFKHYLEPLDTYFTPQEMSRIRGWNAVTDGFKEGAGKIYGVPNASDGISMVYYNKKALAKAGINTDADWPKDFAAFLTMLAKIKATGITPLALFDDGYIMFSLDYWIAQIVGGSPGINDLVSGKRNFSDPQVVEAIQQWTQLAQYSMQGAPTTTGDQAYQFLFQGKAAMTISGPWPFYDMRKALGDDLGLHKLPDYSEKVSLRNTGIGGAGTALIVSNYSKHKAEAVKFIKFLLSQPEQTQQAVANTGTLLNVTDVDFATVYKDPLRVQQQQWGLEPSTMFWPDNVYPAELTNELRAQAQLAWTGKITPQQFMSRLDAKRDEILKSPQQ
ncbi:extracellular solute-binding protein [Ktedonosporobacter rubrisoli]|uniref:Extracellular solute-binding protein n=1 Tax=Ktedonosporobacter rubrisoli TaxID=2509675 RepID=A0A4V0Z0J4_KTERU|nr:substrate-binding domain-containing protein [Ktedonosporobacter rubrisoli]QBD83431.1 extracellular solute-binding protein [Ktedonosporobacter rubrisoli]